MSVRKGLQRLELAGIPIEAISVGGLETCIVLPGFKLAFDIGLCPPEVVKRDTVLFTHAHVDHMGGIAYHTATRSLRKVSRGLGLSQEGVRRIEQRALNKLRRPHVRGTMSGLI